MPFIYQAALLCNDCGNALRRRLIAEGEGPADEGDEATFDSDDFPKFAFEGAESDSPEHCDSQEDCLNAIKLDDDWSIGGWLGNSLTSDGVDYVNEAIEQGGPVARLWADYYQYVL